MTQLTKQQWVVRYGALRQLVHNPERKTSGSFARVWHEGQEYLYNQASGKVIAVLMTSGDKLAYLQRKSLYNQILMHLLGDRPYDTTGATSNSVVQAVGRKMITKEGSSYVPVRRTKQAGTPVGSKVGRIIYANTTSFTGTTSSIGSANWYSVYARQFEAQHPRTSL